MSGCALVRGLNVPGRGAACYGMPCPCGQPAYLPAVLQGESKPFRCRGAACCARPRSPTYPLATRQPRVGAGLRARPLDAAARLPPQQVSFAPPQRVAADVAADLVQLLAIANHAVEKTSLP